MELDSAGRQETGTKLSEFSAYALLALEVLIHPRALPLVDLSSANSFQEVNHRFPKTTSFGSQKHGTPFSSGLQELGNGPLSSDDDLYESWLDSNKETEAPVDSLGKNMDTEKPSETLRVQSGKEIFVADSLGTKSPGGNEHEPAATSADVEVKSYGNKMVVELQQFQESTVQLLESSKGATITAVTGDPKVTKASLGLNSSASNSAENEMASVDTVMVDGGDGDATRGGNTLSAKKSTFAFESDNDSSSDSLPDIVDADPDSD